MNWTPHNERQTRRYVHIPGPGRITNQAVDSIVNAANSSLLGGGGVDGAIHRAGGPAILAECREIRAARGSLPTGEAVTTTAGNLPALRVIHTVGPVWTGGEHELLTRAYANSLTLAMSEGLRTIAFPSISTGAYRFPIQAASRTALATIRRNVETYPAAFDEIRIVLFNEPDYRVYREVLREHGGVS